MGDVMQVRLVLLPDPDQDPSSAEHRTRQLRAEIAELDVDSITPAVCPAPEGAKSTDMVTLGAIVVALSASGGVFTALIETLKDWLSRQSGRHRISVMIDGDTIELERASAAQKQAIVDAYVQRHSHGRAE